MDAIYSTKHLGSKVNVYPSFVEWNFMGQNKNIPISSIASVEHGLDGALTITTNDGLKKKIPTKKKKELKQAILSVM